MKGRFRKGKKAHKQIHSLNNPKKIVLAHRYEAWKTSRATLALKIVLTMITRQQARIQAALIVSRPRPIEVPPAVVIAEKSLALAQLAIDSANAIIKIWKTKYFSHANP